MRLTATLVTLIVIACGLSNPPTSVSGSPQTPQMVILNVRVKDPQGKAVMDVPQGSFLVSENGVPQKISFFMNEQIPLSYGLLIDCSGSAKSHLEDVIRASMKIVNSNKPGDEAFLIRFISSDKIEKVLDLTSDKKALTDGLDSLYVEAGQTAILDAIYLGADYLAKAKIDNTLRRRALIIATDGEERNSYYSAQQLIQLLTSTDIQVFIIAFTDELKKEKHLKAVKLVTVLASDTGGRAYLPASVADLDRIANEIINDIRTQYVIGYVPSGGSIKGFQKVEVSIADNPNQEKRVAVTRVGYSTQK
jgi:Ca-activated chloride channel family protein